MVTNKFDIMLNCKKCDQHGLVSKCCNSQIKFLANGAAKCSQCNKFTKLIPCPNCKEDTNEINIEESIEEIGKMQRKEIIFLFLIILILVMASFSILSSLT